MSDATIDLDVAYEEDEGTLDEALRRLGEEFSLLTTVVTERGPGGGWPVVRFCGAEADVRRMASDRFQLDNELVEELLRPATRLRITWTEVTTYEHDFYLPNDALRENLDCSDVHEALDDLSAWDQVTEKGWLSPLGVEDRTVDDFRTLDGCECECCHGGFCGGCGHAGCGRRKG